MIDLATTSSSKKRKAPKEQEKKAPSTETQNPKESNARPSNPPPTAPDPANPSNSKPMVSSLKKAGAAPGPNAVKKKKSVKLVLDKVPDDSIEMVPGQFLSFAPSGIDTTENVGMEPDIEIGDLTELSVSHLHPCMFCNVTLRVGIMVLAIFEMVTIISFQR
jgi:hypothetical protein